MENFGNQLGTIWEHAAERGPELLVTLVVGLIVVEILIVVLGYILRVANIPKALKKILFSLARVFLWIVLFLVLIQTMGLNNVLVAVTGSSVIVALFLSTGVAPMVSDLIAGLSLGSDRNFQPGAGVRVGDQRTEGVIESMDLRKTRLRGRDGKIHVIPNSVIDKNEWVVVTPVKETPRRVRRTLRKLRSTPRRK